ncbi:MAG: type II secretion system F family protein [Pirellulaceae bacterium]
MSNLLIPLLIFLGIGLTVAVVGQLLIGLGRRDERNGVVRRPLVFGALTGVFALLLPTSRELRRSLEHELRRGGFHHPRALDEFLAIRNVLVVGWLLLVIAAVVATYDPVHALLIPILIVGATVTILLYGVPRLWLQATAAQRVQRIQRALPDALDMITMCLTGGLPLQPALQRVGQEISAVHPDLGVELEIIRSQADAHTLEHSLTQFADRIDVPEIRSLAALVSQTERLGANVATALRDYADSIRRGFRQRAEERGNKNSIKMLLPVALCLAPPVYIMLLAPAVLELRDFVVRENRPGGILVPVETQLDAPVIRPVIEDESVR